MTSKIKYFVPVEELEAQAIIQIEETANLEFVHGIAVMPDAHVGKGSTVGSVIATKNTIIPAAVGVDIGCGMIAVKTKFFAKDLGDSLKDLRLRIESKIPVSAGKYNSEYTESSLPRIVQLKEKELDYYKTISQNAWEKQLGTLGSGNHFIELCLDEEQRLWVVLHSGSRGIGNKLAERHIKIAQEFVKQAGIELPNKDLSFLESWTKEYNDYSYDLMWSQHFALLNREEMMDRVLEELSYYFYKENGHQKDIELTRINCHHNFTQRETHCGCDLLITRKGAIEMRLGQLGIIPGSMGTSTYIVEGLGNTDSYNSAPHGAGRHFSRAEARRRFTMEDFDRELVGVEVNRSKKYIDEIPSAYKDIERVMEYAKPLVKVTHKLKQILNIKGD